MNSTLKAAAGLAGVATKRAVPAERSPAELCLPSFLEMLAGRNPDAVAIGAPGRSPLTYGALFAHVRNVVTALAKPI